MKIEKLIYFVALIALQSCDGFIGEDGVVIDSETGNRIPNVTVSLISEDGVSLETKTDLIGFFNANKLIGCGLGNCDTDFSIKFKLEGYQTTTINETYARNQDTDFVTEGTRDTLIVKLTPN